MARWPVFLLLLAGASALNFDGGVGVLPGVRRSTPDHVSREGILFPDDPRLLRDSVVDPAKEDPLDLAPEPVPDDVLELPDDLNELPLSALEKMNSITSMNEFFELFDLEPPENAAVAKPNADDFSSGLSVDSRFGTSATEVAKMANCKPEETTVPLKLPEEANTIYYPSCVRLPRCGGCCVGSLLECQPTAVKPITLKVVKTVTRSATRRRSSRRRRRRTPTVYFDVEEEEHTACKCDCKVQESHCLPEVHVYNKNECACLCKNKDEEKKCGTKNTTHLWDPKKCQCLCRKQQDCSTGQFFSQASCRCEWTVESRGGLRTTDFQPGEDGISFSGRRRTSSHRRHSGRHGGGRGHPRRPERVPIIERGRRRPERVLLNENILF